MRLWQAISSKAIDIETAVNFLHSFLRDYDLDPHIPTAVTDEIRFLLESYSRGNAESLANKLLSYYYVFHFHSPYLEVRESIPPTDDPTLPVDTFRAWVIGLLLVGIFSAMNQVIAAIWTFVIS